MRKIFVNPSVKEIELLGGNICNPGSTGVGTGASLGGDVQNDNEENGFAPVRLDIFNYGGLQ